MCSVQTSGHLYLKLCMYVHNNSLLIASICQYILYCKYIWSSVTRTSSLPDPWSREIYVLISLLMIEPWQAGIRTTTVSIRAAITIPHRIISVNNEYWSTLLTTRFTIVVFMNKWWWRSTRKLRTCIYGQLFVGWSSVIPIAWVHMCFLRVP